LSIGDDIIREGVNSYIVGICTCKPLYITSEVSTNWNFTKKFSNLENGKANDCVRIIGFSRRLGNYNIPSYSNRDRFSYSANGTAVWSKTTLLASFTSNTI
jgi:hypothetical protein